MVKYTGRDLVVKRLGVLSKVQVLNFVLGVGVFSLLPILQGALACVGVGVGVGVHGRGRVGVGVGVHGRGRAWARGRAGSGVQACMGAGARAQRTPPY